MPEPLHADDPRTIGGYNVECRLGAGGMGTVFKAWNAAGFPVAIKVISRSFVSNAAYRTRFRREIAAASRVPRFCTAPIIDSDPDAEPPFLVTEYIPGPSLAERVATEGPQRGPDIENLAVATAAALKAIHEADIVHRDLKPANVLLGPYGPRIIDFGLSMLLDAHDSASYSGQVLGTPAFMAPEQLDGQQVDNRADIFSWGALIAYAATGRLLDRPREDHEQAAAYSTAALREYCGEIDRRVADVLIRALSVKPSDRPSAEKVLLMLTSAGVSSEVLMSAASVAQPVRSAVPLSAEDWAAEAEASLQQSKATLALFQARRAAELDPNNARSYCIQGLAHIALDRYPLGIDQLRLAYEMRSDDPLIRRSYAHALLANDSKQGNSAEADEATLGLAWSVAPEDDLVRSHYLDHLLRKGEEGVNEAYQIAPDSVQVRDAYSRSLLRRGSEESIKLAIAVSPAFDTERRGQDNAILDSFLTALESQLSLLRGSNGDTVEDIIDAIIPRFLTQRWARRLTFIRDRAFVASHERYDSTTFAAVALVLGAVGLVLTSLASVDTAILWIAVGVTLLVSRTTIYLFLAPMWISKRRRKRTSGSRPREKVPDRRSAASNAYRRYQYLARAISWTSVAIALPVAVIAFLPSVFRDEPEACTMKVVAELQNVRVGPGYEYALVDVAHQGEVVAMTGEVVNGFGRRQDGRWMDLQYLSSMPGTRC